MEFPKLQTLNGEIAFDEAIQEEHNTLQRLTYPQKRHDFSSYLDQHRTKIEALVSSHLGLKRPGDCQLIVLQTSETDDAFPLEPISQIRQPRKGHLDTASC